MGEVTPTPQPTIQHFSHPHPLHLSNHSPLQTLSPSSCSACQNKVSGRIYSCHSCNYFLHIKCSDMPKKIKHPSHPTHTFLLHPTPPYPEGVFSCDACGKPGSGFSYHCKICTVDLHILCAEMPLSIAHHAHHHHLGLAFAPPYHDQGFSCDLCKNPGANHWLYRCNSCNFDVHLECAKSTGPPTAQPGRVQEYPTTFVPGTGPSPVRPGRVQQFQTTFAPPVRVHAQSFQTSAPSIQYVVRPPVQSHPQNNAVNVGNSGVFGFGMPGQNNGYYCPPNNMVSTGNPGFYGSGTPGQSNWYYYQPSNVTNPGNNSGVFGSGNSGQNDGIADVVFESFVSGAAEAAGQQLVQGLVGGSSSDNGGGGGGGGGGDGNYSSVDVYSSGDVGGMDSSLDFSTYP